jgi:hypothetical protein
MLLLLRALVILGAVLAVISCRSALAAPTGPVFEGMGDPMNCALDVSSSWESVPAAGGTISNSGAGMCL